jgi:ATPase subunit of ABC transporter with duplicated ATPase domains
VREEKNKEMMIRLFRVSKHYGKKSALIDLTVDVAADDFVFVTGPSGAGKSTMIKLLYMGEAILRVPYWSTASTWPGSAGSRFLCYAENSASYSRISS